MVYDGSSFKVVIELDCWEIQWYHSSTVAQLQINFGWDTIVKFSTCFVLLWKCNQWSVSQSVTLATLVTGGYHSTHISLWSFAGECRPCCLGLPVSGHSVDHVMQARSSMVISPLHHPLSSPWPLTPSLDCTAPPFPNSPLLPFLPSWFPSHLVSVWALFLRFHVSALRSCLNIGPFLIILQCCINEKMHWYSSHFAPWQQ